MFMTLLALAIVLLISYIWVMRGFFSSMINMICVIVGGAIAFAVWEPVSHMLLNATPARGFFQFLGDAAWGLGLVVPFVVSTALLRLLVDSILGANARVHSTVDYIGGGACGAVAGIITAGFVVLGLGLMRGKSDGLGYQRIVFRSGNGVGSVVRNPDAGLLNTPWVDQITAGLYEHMSLTSLRPSEPLARWYPEFEDVGPANRLSLENGKARNAMGIKDADVVGSYIIGDPAKPQPIAGAMIQDKWDQAQKVVQIDGSDVPPGYIQGVVVSFRPSAKERKLAQVVIGNAQVRLLVEDAGGDTRSAYPFAAVTRARNETEDNTVVNYARFRFNSSRGFFPCSVGAESTVMMGFEFAVPGGYRPLAIYVKNVRFDLPSKEPPRFARMGDLDEHAEIARVIADPAGMAGPVGEETIGTPNRPGQDQGDIARARSYGCNITTALGHVIQKGTEGALKIQAERRGYSIVEGQQLFERKNLSNRGVGQNLRIDKFALDVGTVIVQVDVSPASPSSILGSTLELAEMDQPPVLVASNGATYQAVGFIYEDKTYVEVRYTRSVPIASITELQKQLPSRSRPDQALKLVFRCSAGAEIVGLRVGSKQLTYEIPFKLDAVLR